MPGKWRNRTFGVEMEIATNVSKADALAKLRSNVSGVEFTNDGYSHAVTKAWKIVPDSSISPAGFELVSPVLKGLKGLRELRRVCQGLKASGIEHDGQNRTCGMHVHIGAKDIQDNAKAFAKLLLFYENLERRGLKKTLPASRRNNQYCKDMWPEVLRKAKTGSCTRKEAIALAQHRGQGARYVSLNCFGRTEKYGTVEFRRGMGTTEFDKILSWLMLHLIMVENCANLKKKEKFGQNLAAIGLGGTGAHKKLKEWSGKYLIGRKRKFSGERDLQLPAAQPAWLNEI